MPDILAGSGGNGARANGVTSTSWFAKMFRVLIFAFARFIYCTSGDLTTLIMALPYQARLASLPISMLLLLGPCCKSLVLPLLHAMLATIALAASLYAFSLAIQNIFGSSSSTFVDIAFCIRVEIDGFVRLGDVRSGP